MVVVCTIPSGSGGAICSGNCVETFAVNAGGGQRLFE